jgi:serine/threonine protein kinase
MAADPALDAFLAALRRSRLFAAPELDRLVAKERPESARGFADALVRGHELTHYQAEKLLQGHWQALVVGPYSVLAPLGRGGMGTVVYLARDRRAAEALGDTELLALKLLSARKAAAEPKVLARFRREMDLGRRADHPNVVRALAAGEVDDVHYLALEFVPGKTLWRIIRDRGKLGVGEAARVFADVAAGLQHVHERGLVHRDVKPGNVMVRPDGRAVLFDLGLALAPGDPLPADPEVVGGRGYVVGTMDFIAPEQARDSAAVGPAADLYGLGCSLFYALTGGPPFPSPHTREKLRRHRTEPPPRVPAVPPAFARLVRRLMAKSPADRPKSAAAVRELLLPWATPAKPVAAVDALAAADAPGLDAGLWDVPPGEDLPPAAGESESFALLDQWTDSSAVAFEWDAVSDPGARARARAASTRTGWLLVGLLVGLMGLVLLVAVARRL